MYLHFFTRITIIPVFLFTCLLTADVVAKERELAPILTPDAWLLINDVIARQEGVNPPKVTLQKLEPRRKSIKQTLIKHPNSRVMVKFADDLKVRVDQSNALTSKTGNSVEHIQELLNSLDVTLSRTTSNSEAKIDALIKRAENFSRKQQPDLGGIFWIDGDSSAVDLAAEILFASDDVEWVIYKPVFSKIPSNVLYRNPTIPTQVFSNDYDVNNNPSTRITLTGACLVTNNNCLENITDIACENRGGVFLGNNSICQVQNRKINNRKDYKRNNKNSNNLLGVVGACCFANSTCDDTGIEDDCNTNGGWWAGDGTTCDVPTCSGDPTTDPGQCCVPTDCIVVTGEDQCWDIYNGIFLGDSEDDPIDPCGDSQTDCPTGEDHFNSYDMCAEPDMEQGVTWLTGDCYIDQTAIVQTNRIPVGLDGTPAGPFPIGCADTPGTMGGPQGNDLVADFVYDSPCCEDISVFGECGTGAWGMICANLANDPAFRGSSCWRPGANSPQPLGPTQIIQPQLNLDNIGTGVTIYNDGTTGHTNAMIGIAPAVAGEQDKLLTVQTEAGEVAGSPFTLDDATSLTNIATTINNLADGWNATAFGEVNDTFAYDLLTFPTTSVFGEANAGTINAAPLTAVTRLLYTPAPAGFPTIPRTTATPDYAEMGLLAWMSGDPIPFTVSGSAVQARPLPILDEWDDETAAGLVKFTYLNQLLPWPMGGASTDYQTYPPPISELLYPSGWFGGEGVDLFPSPPNPEGFGSGGIYEGSFGFGQLFADETTAETVNGAYGNDVKVAVLDWSAYLQTRTNNAGVVLGGVHEEFTNSDGSLAVTLEGPDTGDDAIDMLFDDSMEFRYSADHGTAVLGVIAANWGPASAPGADILTRIAGNVGVLGMAPDADVYFFPLTNVTQDDNREMDAWNNAIEELDSGDVICAAYTPVSSNTGAPNLNFWQDTNVRMELAKNLGICVVVRAGDGVGGLCTDLLTIEPADGDQFAIVASAVSPGEPYKRWADSRNGSNYVAGSQDYTKLNISGWGLGVTTCGKGPNRDNYLGYFTTIYDDPTDANEVNSRSYTQNFGNTAAAAAVAAGTLAQVQGFSKQIFGIGLGPQVARQLLSKGKYEGTARDGTPILTETPTDTEDDRDSSCDTIIANPTVNFDYCPVIAPTGWLTGSFANPRNSMVNVATNPIFDTPNIVDFMVIRGDYIYGNKFSLASQDGQLFGIYGEPTRAHIAYPVPPTVPGDTVSYLSNGDTTDLHVEGNMHNGIPFSGKLQIDIQFQSTQPEVMKLRLFMWDYNRHYWRHVGSETNLPNGTESVSIEVENASRYIEAITNDFHLRVTTLDFAGPTDGPNDQPLPIFYDQITVSDAPVVSPEE